MITRDQIPSVLGHMAYDPAHKKLGRIGQVFVDDDTGTPEWMTVQTGMLGGKETFVPLMPAQLEGDDVVLPFPQDQIKGAPKVETEAGHLAPSEEIRLYEYYGMEYQPYAMPEAGTAEEPGTARLHRYTVTEYEERTEPREGPAEGEPGEHWRG
jgi:hypothetical protein